ncbi:MAG: hypothetical protein JW893_05545 [Candidatus Omnitrophica bacterium]|nr:hypothetical protein [Candidatus Omnitrophota bacterium]
MAEAIPNDAEAVFEESGKEEAMIAQINLVSGEVLTLLGQLESPILMEDIKQSINAHEDIVMMSLGWLIREGHVYAIPRATGTEIKPMGNDTNEEMHERALI